MHTPKPRKPIYSTVCGINENRQENFTKINFNLFNGNKLSFGCVKKEFFLLRTKFKSEILKKISFSTKERGKKIILRYGWDPQM